MTSPGTRCHVHAVCELVLSREEGVSHPFALSFHASFSLSSAVLQPPIIVRGFYDGGITWRVRFSPPAPGLWHWHTNSTDAPWLVSSGALAVGAAEGGARGPVHAAGRVFRYVSGEEYLLVGTTSYAWAHQNASMRAATLQAMRKSPFNKLRMTVFPKWYPYNYQEPASGLYPFEGSPPTSWDFSRFNLPFWWQLEGLVRELQALDVIAELILFHPYDHWGFACMGGSDAVTYDLHHDIAYVRYVVARLGAFSNVWWSLANEWDFIGCKARGLSDQPSKSPVWDALGATLAAEDPYDREASIHNGVRMYNHSREWVTHISLQGNEEQTPSIVKGRYGVKPVVWDEVRYEGDIPEEWGSLSGPEMADRFWWGHSLGAYVGHSETLMMPGLRDDDQLMWWSKGGRLHGTSQSRISWFARTVGHESRPPLSQLTPYDAEPLCDCQGSVLLGDGYALFHIAKGPANVPQAWQRELGQLVQADVRAITSVHLTGARCAFNLSAFPAHKRDRGDGIGGDGVGRRWDPTKESWPGVGRPRSSPRAQQSGNPASFRVIRLDWWNEMETEMAAAATGVFRTSQLGRLPANIEIWQN